MKVTRCIIIAMMLYCNGTALLADYKWYDIIMNCDIKLKGVHYSNAIPHSVLGRAWSWFDTTAWNYGGPRGLTQ